MGTEQLESLLHKVPGQKDIILISTTIPRLLLFRSLKKIFKIIKDSILEGKTKNLQAGKLQQLKVISKVTL